MRLERVPTERLREESRVMVAAQRQILAGAISKTARRALLGWMYEKVRVERKGSSKVE